MIELQELGTIELSGNTIISDPGYDRKAGSSLIQGFVVKPGQYIVCYHNESFADVHEVARRRWVIAGYGGVDTGEAGIFDDSIYPHGEINNDEVDDPNSFCGEGYQITSHLLCGCLNSGKGVVTESGYGDCGYALYAVYQQNECIAMILDFRVVKMRQSIRLYNRAKNTISHSLKISVRRCTTTFRNGSARNQIYSSGKG